MEGSEGPNPMMHDSLAFRRAPPSSSHARRIAPTYQRALEQRLERWEAFGRLLRDREERVAFMALTRSARRHVAEATYVGSPDLLESILLSVLLDLSRRLPPEAPNGPARRSVSVSLRERRVSRPRVVRASSPPNRHPIGESEPGLPASVPSRVEESPPLMATP
ncbi:MAG TPA: hypothetical protein VGU43_02360 [Thermoplasmata archaeon]|nr:hypothetical protein [Thermoplasmata archaeon]